MSIRSIIIAQDRGINNKSFGISIRYRSGMIAVQTLSPSPLASFWYRIQMFSPIDRSVFRFRNRSRTGSDVIKMTNLRTNTQISNKTRPEQVLTTCTSMLICTCCININGIMQNAESFSRFAIAEKRGSKSWVVFLLNCISFIKCKLIDNSVDFLSRKGRSRFWCKTCTSWSSIQPLHSGGGSHA